MRILVTSNYFPEHVGGVGTVAAGLVDRYRRAGHEVSFAAASVGARRGHPADLPLRAWNITQRRFGFPYPLPGPVSAARLAALAREADVVHVHDCLYAATSIAFAGARSAGRPLLLTQHIAEVPYRNPVVRGLQSAAYRTLGRSLLARADQVVFVSARVCQAFADVGYRRRPKVIENGVDTAVFGAAPAAERRRLRQNLEVRNGRPLLLFAGRFVEKKGIHVLREAAAAQPDWDWVLVGGAGDQDPRGWRLSNVRVFDALPQAKLRDLYAAADLLVLPSRGEGFPLVVQEAMACGTPAVISHETATGLVEKSDLIFESEPEVRALRECVRSALPRLSDRFRQRVAACALQRWSLDRVAAEYLGIIESLAA